MAEEAADHAELGVLWCVRSLRPYGPSVPLLATGERGARLPMVCNHLGRAHSALTQRIDVLHLFISRTLISLVWLISRSRLLIVHRCGSYMMAG